MTSANIRKAKVYRRAEWGSPSVRSFKLTSDELAQISMARDSKAELLRLYRSRIEDIYSSEKQDK